MNACPSCPAARINPDSGLYNAACPECQARSLADSPAYWKACALGRITSEYKSALLTLAKPGESVEDTHKRVRAWADHVPGTEA